MKRAPSAPSPLIHPPNDATSVARYAIEPLERRALLSDVGNIFIADTASRGVSEVSTDGKLIDRSVVAGVGDAGVAVSGGDLFIVNKAAGTVGEYSTAGGTVNSKLITGLIGPDFITIGGGHIFVADDFDSRIGEYSLTGTPVGVGLIEGISSVEGIAANSTDLFVMIAPANSNAVIAEYNSGGGVVNPALVSGVLCNIGTSSLTLSGSDLFATDQYIGNIAEYTTAGATVSVPFSRDLDLNNASIAVTGSDLYAIQFDLPYGVYGSNGSIGVYTTSGQTINASLITGNPTAIATDGSTLFLLNRGGGVSEYSLAGAPLNSGLPPSPTYNGIAVQGSDLFLTDTQAGTIAEYTTNGAMVNPALITGLNSPNKLTVFGNRLFVADSTGVGEYTTTGQAINANLIAESVSSVQVLGSNLLVADGDTIREFSMTGTTINPALVEIGSPYPAAPPSGIVDFTVLGNDLFVATGEFFITHPSENLSGVVEEFTTSGKQVNLSLATSENFTFGGVVAFGSSFYVSDDQFGDGYTINGGLFQTGIVSQYSFAGASQSTVGYVVTDEDAQPADSLCIEPATVGPATQLVVIQPPAAVVVGSASNPPIIVALEDSDGNIVTDDSSTITLTPANGASVRGILSQPATGGVAILSDLTFPSAGSYTLTASTAALPAVNFRLTATVLPTTVITSSTMPSSTIGFTLHGRVTATLTNNTPTAERGLALFRIYASTAGQINPGTLIATRRLQVDIKPGGHARVPVFVGPLAVDLPGGSYTLLAQCTGPDGLISSSTSGPVVKIAPPAIDFQVAIASASVPATLIAKQRTRAVIAVTVANSGNVASHGPTTIVVRLYENGDGFGAGILVQRTLPYPIRAGQTIQLRIPLRAIPKLPAGPYTLEVDVNDMAHDGSGATVSPVTVQG